MTGELHVFSEDQTRRVVGKPCAWQAILPPADRSPGLARRVARDALADKWGVLETPAGKAVWAELDARQPGVLGPN